MKSADAQQFGIAVLLLGAAATMLGCETAHPPKQPRASGQATLPTLPGERPVSAPAPRAEVDESRKTEYARPPGSPDASVAVGRATSARPQHTRTETPHRKARTEPPEPRIARKRDSYDPTGPAFALLQAPKTALSGFPVDRMGKIDWVAALSSGKIAPRSDLLGVGQMTTLDSDIIMKRTREMPWVRFPHRQHTEWLACSNCHPSPFAEKAGSSGITMDSIMRGRHCGMCHDRVAFSILLCERCHSEPHPGSPERWW